MSRIDSVNKKLKPKKIESRRTGEVGSSINIDEEQKRMKHRGRNGDRKGRIRRSRGR